MLKRIGWGTLVLVIVAVALPGFAQQEKFIPSKTQQVQIDADSLTAGQIDRARRLSELLMAPCCYAKTAAEDQSGQAWQVKQQVRLGIQQGYSDQQILAGFREVYGERILARPTAEGFNRLVWVLPFVALLFGGWLAYRYIHRTKTKHDDRISDEDETPKAKAAAGGDDYDQRVEDELRSLDR